ncbi:MAG: beta propeller repeat protein, partial [Mycobacteriales bacterium]
TSDGGAHWVRTSVGQIVDLEVAAGRVWAIVGPLPYGTIEDAPVGTTAFATVAMAPNRGTELVVHGSEAYLLGESGAGPVAQSLEVSTGGPPVQRTFPCRPTGGNSTLAVSTRGLLVLDCTPYTGRTQLWASADDGRAWRAWTPPAASQFPYGGSAATATRYFTTGPAGIVWTSDSGAHWTLSLPVSGAQTYVSVLGFTDDLHGVAITIASSPSGQVSSATLWMSADGGTSWQPRW